VLLLDTGFDDVGRVRVASPERLFVFGVEKKPYEEFMIVRRETG
jgi:hypothetical protein